MPDAPPPAAQAAPPPPQRSAAKGCLRRIGLFFLSLLLAVLAVRGPVLGIVGKATSATVTEVKQNVSQTSDKMDYNFTVRYAFTAAGAKRSGSASLAKVYNAAKLPKKGSTLRVRYLEAWPAINAAERECTPGLATLVLGALAALLLFLAVKPRRAAS